MDMREGPWSGEELKAMAHCISSHMNETKLLHKFGREGLPCPVCGSPVRVLPFHEAQARYVVNGFRTGRIQKLKVCDQCVKSGAGRKHIEVTDRFWAMAREGKPDNAETLREAMKEIGFEYPMQ